MADNGLLLPGTFGLSHGSGLAGRVIRRVEQELDKLDNYPDDASWAGHAFVYVGHGSIVEATWPRVRIAKVSSHSDAKWAIREPLTDEQRQLIVKRAFALVGDRYDVLAYAVFAAELVHAGIARDIAPLAAHDAWRVCSAVVADTRLAAGINYMTQLRKLLPKFTATNVNNVRPADLYALAELNHWL